MIKADRMSPRQIEQKKDVSVRSLSTSHWYALLRRLRRALARIGLVDDFAERMLRDAEIRAVIEATTR
jgi:hypothetical protein